MTEQQIESDWQGEFEVLVRLKPGDGQILENTNDRRSYRAAGDGNLRDTSHSPEATPTAAMADGLPESAINRAAG